MNVFHNNLYNAIKKMEITKPMYNADIVREAKCSRGNIYTVLDVLNRLVEEGILVEVVDKYEFTKYARA